ncbi:MAG: hypothetical protein COV72_06780 [Candidatus Omnitrophica bacterium CG11_big_fil_rev_8_21_14_0_20_42_13]|uniref:Sulfate exporter family transporter n=1 Tax=Candidatus Ghiorseimicrobium undicola TaxID=1974746 RepID=A0A2H0LWJ6_9BACT|nr:MAG: hypothetical protein COV72_06780 [Candidatus Omnitrophica bacterium CG11_big_fil_rev_8_21_14_0_20_42_13]
MIKNSSLFRLALPGVLIALGISFISYFLSGLHKFLDSFALAIILGVLVGSCFPRKNSLWIGTALCKDILLPLGLLMYGTEVNFEKLSLCCVIGSNILFLCIVDVAICFLAVYFINKIFRINNKTNLLTACGSAICGIAAVAVGSPMVDAEEEDVTRAVIAVLVVGALSFFCTTVFFSKFFTADIDIYGEKFAVFCGMTLNQEGLVETAGKFMEKGLDTLALNVKHIRSIFIVPLGFVILLLSQLGKKNINSEVRLSVIKYGFTIGFLFFGAALLFTFTPLGNYSDAIRPMYKLIFGAALAAVGLTCDIRKVFKKETLLNTLSAFIGWAIIVAVFIGLVFFSPGYITINQIF